MKMHWKPITGTLVGLAILVAGLALWHQHRMEQLNANPVQIRKPPSKTPPAPCLDEGDTAQGGHWHGDEWHTEEHPPPAAPEPPETPEQETVSLSREARYKAALERDVGGTQRRAVPITSATDRTRLTVPSVSVTEQHFRYDIRAIDRNTDGITLADADPATAAIEPFRTAGTVCIANGGATLNKATEY